VGHSGSGKTSFVRLLQCLYPIQQGRILVDGQDIMHGSRLSLRSAIALVPQDPILFHRTLRENIAYGNPEANMEAIKDAAEQAHIAEFIAHLPEQYDTLVGERGIKLSVASVNVSQSLGQYWLSAFLILDEATSSLDSASERAIQDALAFTDSWSYFHHGSSSSFNDLRRRPHFCFDHGEIVEEGKHDELIRKANGIYAEFFKLQSASGRLFKADQLPSPQFSSSFC